MAFRSLRFYNFRNLADAAVPVHSEQVFFIGPNGQGKSNFLEAVYLLCYGSSFRTRRDEEIVRHNETAFSLIGDWQDERRTAKINLKFEDGKKTILLDGAALADRAELVSHFPCIVFSHEDIDFVKGGPERQRTFFNQTAGLVNPRALSVLRDYSRILRTRNQVLKDGRADLLDVYDEQLASVGLELQENRRASAELVDAELPRYFAEISGSGIDVRVTYEPSWPEGADKSKILARLAAARGSDLYRKTSTSGPHRDRFVFRFDGREAATVASTGQLRLLSLILRLLQARLLADARAVAPVLLIDDVLLELDAGKRRAFLAALPAFEQVFYTFLPDEQLVDYLGDGHLSYTVENGRFS